MTTRTYTDERRWAKFDHSESRTRIRQHVKSPYEHLFDDYIAALRSGDYESAMSLKAKLREASEAA